MGILNRFKDIMASNVNALLDKVEDPEKMIDQTIRNLNKDLAKVTSETASVMAEEKRAKRMYNACSQEVEKLQQYAVKALTLDNEEDAKKFLTAKAEKSTELTTLQTSLEVASTNSKNMKAMHTKLQSDVKALEAKRAQLKAKFAAAKAQEKINKMMSGSADAANSISAFERYEEKANQAFDKATAMSELNADNDSTDDLMSKYDSTSPNVDDELAQLKASLGK